MVQVVEAMWCWLWRLCGDGCGDYVALVAEDMWWLQRLCGSGGYVVQVMEPVRSWQRKMVLLVMTPMRF